MACKVLLTCNNGKGLHLLFFMLQNQSKIFQYNGSPITFNLGDSVMVNATEMAKPFGKFTKDWLTNKQTKEFISSLSAVRTIPLTELVQVVQGGDPTLQGTWMHEDVAMEFARWLSPLFAIWCNDRIKELLTQGVATVNDDDTTILHAIQVLQKRVEEKQRALQTAQATITTQSEQLKSQAPKVEYYDQVLQSEGTMTTTQLAMSLGMTANRLNRMLCDAKIQYRQSGMYILYAPYSSWNIASVRTYPFTKSDGTMGTNRYLVWNERGCQFVTMLHSNNFDVKKTRNEISPEFWIRMLRPQCLPSADK